MRIDKETLRTTIVCMAICIFYFSTIVFKMSTLQVAFGFPAEMLYSMLHMLVYVLLAVSVLLRNSLNVKSMLLYLILAGVCIYSYMNLRLLYFADIVLFIAATEKIDDKRIVTSVIASIGISVLLVIYMATAGLIENRTHLKDFDLRTITYSMGFQEINWLGALLLEVLLAWVYLRYEKLGFIDILLGVAIYFYLRNTSFSRTALYLILFLPVVVILFKVINHFDKKKKFMIFTTFLIVLPAGLSFFMIAFYTPKNEYFAILNLLTTNRLSLMNLQLRDYGVSLFGQALTNIKAFDNAYVRCGVWYGVILLLAYVLGQITISRWAVKYDNIALYILMIVYAVQGTVESFPLFLRFNFTYLLYANVLISMWTEAKTKKCDFIGDNQVHSILTEE